MGFRDFQLFNSAMLGKQGWRLLSRKGSLCERVIKGKYYPRSDFLSARKKKRSSATWKAILHGKEVLARGLIHRIGPGDIDIWQDNWIPGLTNLRPIVRLPGVEVNRVHELFIPGTRCWDEHKVRQSFLAIESNEVLKIRMGTNMEQDILAWAHEKNGVYSVRSAYRLLKNDQMAKAVEKNSEAGGSAEERVWKLLWKLNVPPKVRSFWWRVVHNFVPAKAELKRRHIAKESFCEVCGAPDENVYHVVFQCTTAKRFWEAAEQTWELKIPEFHPASWTLDVLQAKQCSQRMVELIVCGAWSLWTGRNARRNGRKSWEPGAAVRYISKLMEDMASLSAPKKQQSKRMPMKWQRPEQSWVKVNSDGAFATGSCQGSGGVAIRDENGALIAAAARWFDDVADALMAEALAAKEGLELAAEVGCDNVILEVDSSELKMLLDSDSYLSSAVGGICSDIRGLSNAFSGFKIAWIGREANGLAHECAKLVSEVDRSFFWLDDFPDWLLGLASKDCTPVDG
jgi:hypothetical protein